jgi:hypothetical protein
MGTYITVAVVIWITCFIGMYVNSYVLGKVSNKGEESLENISQNNITQFKKLEKLIKFYDSLTWKEKIVCVSFGFGLFIFATLYGSYWYFKYLFNSYYPSK